MLLAGELIGDGVGALLGSQDLHAELLRRGDLAVPLGACGDEVSGFRSDAVARFPAWPFESFEIRVFNSASGPFVVGVTTIFSGLPPNPVRGAGAAPSARQVRLGSRLRSRGHHSNDGRTDPNSWSRARPAR